MEEILVLKTVCLIDKDMYAEIYNNILKQKENGIILLPRGVEFVTVCCGIDIANGDDFTNGIEPQKEKRYCRDCKHFWETKEYEPGLNGFKSYYGCYLNHINRRLLINDKTEDCGLFEEKEKGNE